MKKSDKKLVDRRKFLTGAAVGGAAALAASTGTVGAQQLIAAAAPVDAPTGTSNVEVLTVDRSGSDFMVDVIKSLGFEYVAANPGSELPRTA